MLDVGDEDVADVIDAEAVAERLVRVALDPGGQLRIGDRGVPEVLQAYPVQRRAVKCPVVQPIVVQCDAVDAAA